MGQDAVFVHLVFTYFITRQTPWIEEVQLTNIIDKAMRISPNLIGTTAPFLKMPDDKGVLQDLHKIKHHLQHFSFTTQIADIVKQKHQKSKKSSIPMLIEV